MTWQPPSTPTGGSFTATVSNVNSRLGIDSADAGETRLTTQSFVSNIVSNMTTQQGTAALNAPTPYAGVPAGQQGYYKWQ